MIIIPKKAIFHLIILMILFFFILGKCLDMEAERVVRQLYPRDSNGVIQGLEPIQIIRGGKNAIIFVHGFQESPATFHDIITDIKPKLTDDLYAPLLSYHGRDLESLVGLDDTVVSTQLEKYIHAISLKYKTVTVVALSFGGAVLANIVRGHTLPQNVHFIFYAPAIYIRSNTTSGYIQLYLYNLWRSYCNYSSIDCNIPSYSSADSSKKAKQFIAHEKTLQYKVTPAILEMYQMDLNNRNTFRNIQHPFDLIIAKDDNRIDFQKITNGCLINKYNCHLHVFENGSHIIHIGKHKKEFEELIIVLVNNNKQSK